MSPAERLGILNSQFSPRSGTDWFACQNPPASDTTFMLTDSLAVNERPTRITKIFRALAHLQLWLRDTSGKINVWRNIIMANLW